MPRKPPGEGPNPHNFVILVLAVAFGFIAGLTFDVVFNRLQSVNAVPADVLRR